MISFKNLEVYLIRNNFESYKNNTNKLQNCFICVTKRQKRKKKLKKKHIYIKITIV